MYHSECPIAQYVMTALLMTHLLDFLELTPLMVGIITWGLTC